MCLFDRGVRSLPWSSQGDTRGELPPRTPHRTFRLDDLDVGVEVRSGAGGSHQGSDGSRGTAGATDDLPHVGLVDGEAQRHAALAVDHLDGDLVGLRDETLRQELEDLDERAGFEPRKLRYGAAGSSSSLAVASGIGLVEFCVVVDVFEVAV